MTESYIANAPTCCSGAVSSSNRAFINTNDVPSNVTIQCRKVSFLLTYARVVAMAIMIPIKVAMKLLPVDSESWLSEQRTIPHSIVYTIV